MSTPNKSMPLPNFLIVGGEKCGTTALYGYLVQHSDVFIPEVKECRYFSDMGNAVLNPFNGDDFAKKGIVYIPKTLDEYSSLFDSSTQPLRGDASPDYLYFAERSVPNIINTLGADAKIIIMLRDPIQRAFSNYLHHVRENLTSLSFDEYLVIEDKFDQNATWWGFYIKRVGLYAKSVRLFIEKFPQTKVVFFDDFVSAPQHVTQEVLQFLGAKGEHALNKPAFTNKTGVTRNPLVQNALAGKWAGKDIVKAMAKGFLGEKRFNDALIRMKEWNLKKPEISPQAIGLLREYYADDVAELEIVLGKKVPWHAVYQRALISER